MTIYFATDHAGFALKEVLLRYVRDELGFVVEDCGAFTENPEDDYPLFMQEAARRIVENPNERRAIIIGGSGQGEAIAANRFHGVRAAVYYGGPLDIVRLSREHNDANVLSLGARFVHTEDAKEAVHLWLSTSFSNDARHIRRIAALEL